MVLGRIRRVTRGFWWVPGGLRVKESPRKPNESPRKSQRVASGRFREVTRDNNESGQRHRPPSLFNNYTQ